MKDQFGGIILEDANSQFAGGQTDQFGGILINPNSMEEINISEVNASALNNVIDLNSSDAKIKPLIDEAESQRQQMLMLAESRFSPDVIKSWENNPIGFGEAFNFLDWEDVTPVVGGVAKGANYLKLANISKNVEEGKPINANESEFLNEFIDKQIEIKLRGMSYGGKISYYGSPLPAFMIEFGLTGGIGKTVQASTLKAIGTAAETTALKAVTAKTAGRVARVATQSAAMVPMTVANYGERRLGPWMVTDKGQLIFQQAQESPAMSALIAYGYTNAEVASELSGATLGKYIINPITKKLNTPLINGLNALPVSLKEGLFNAYKSIKPNATISKAFARGGWNGMLAELGEERIADILRETVNLSLEEGYTFDEVIDGITPSKDQLLLEAGLISILGGVKTSGNLLANIFISNGLSQNEANSSANNLSAIEQESVLDQELQVDKTPYIPVEKILLPDAPTVKSELLEEYDQFQQQEGEYATLIELKEGQILTLEKKLSTAKRKNTPLGKIIAQAGGINVQSYLNEMGGDKADLTDVNKQLGVTVFRVNGGMQVDDITRQIDSDYWQGFEFEKEEADLNDVLDVVDKVRVDPKFPAFPEKQANVDAIETELNVLQSTETDVLDKYYNALEKEVEIEAVKQNDFTPQGFPVSESEFNRINIEINDYIESQQIEAEPTIDPVIGSQTDAFIENEPTAIAPNQSIFNDWYYKWFDSLGALTALSREAAKRAGLAKAGERLEILARQFAGVVGMATSNITAQTYIIDADGNIKITGNGLKPILEDFDNSVFNVEPNKKQRKQDLNDFLIATRILEDLKIREDVKISDVQKLKSITNLANLATKYGDSFKWFEFSAKDIYAFQRRILQNLVSSGNISKKQYDDITKANPNYIPFQRVMDEESVILSASNKRLFSNATASKILKKIKGSDKDIKDPINSIMLNTFKILDLSWQNRIANTIGNLAATLPEYIQPVKPLMQKIMIDGKAEFRPSPIEPKGTITVYKEGKKKYFKVDPAILKALEQLSPSELGFIEKMFAAPARLLRAGATLVPEFWARNVLRDLQGAFIQSKARPTPIDAVAGLTALMGKAELHQRWMQSGGSFNSYMELSDNGMEKAQKELLNNNGKLIRFLKNPLTLPSDISLSLEQSVRLGVYKAAKAKGMSDIEAGFEARDATLDFARGGRASKIINRYIPFFNAGMQGADKLARTIKSNPKATIMWATATITMPSIILSGYYLYGASEDEKQEYLEIPQWQKDMFWVWKKDGVWMRYPKPFTLGYLFGSVPERFMNWMHSEGIEDGKEFWFDLTKGVAGSISPIYDPSAAIPPLVKVTIENVTNYNFFQGRRIYPEWMETLTPEERKTKGTSQTSIEIGEAIGVSPAKVENALRGTIAGSARYVTDAGDYIINSIKEYNGEKIPAKPTSPTDYPLVRAFTMQFPTGNRAESTQDFYDLLKLGRQAKNTFKDLKGDARQKFRNNNLVLLRSIPALESASKQMAKLNKRRNKIYEDGFMTGKEKEIALRKLDDQILNQAKRANNIFQNNLNDL